MAGNKFGTTGNEHFTWAMNTYLPGRVAEHFKGANIVAFSTGNVYPAYKGGVMVIDLRELRIQLESMVNPLLGESVYLLFS